MQPGHINQVRLDPAATAADVSPTALAYLERQSVFAMFLATALEQAMELESGRLTDVVRIMQVGGDWEAASGTWGFE